MTFGLIYALAAFAWINVLIQPYGLFDFVPGFVEKFIKSEKVKYPLIYCTACCAGQLAFWVGITLGFIGVLNWFAVIISIPTAITAGKFLDVIYEKLRI